MSFVTPGEKIRVRFAPSPTGFLHVGGARSAIFNWLFARKYHGDFLLRIEDTDAERSGEEMVAAILSGMKWLGLNWDEELVFQSKRLPVYQQHLDQLIASGKAYKCYCTKEEIEAARQLAKSEKRDYRYRSLRKCYHLSDEKIKAFEDANTPHCIRLLLPDGETVFEDGVYGRIKVEHTQLDDFIVRRPDGYPTYHFAVVADDHDMNITHVMRGDDHLSNTPKHILLYQAFGWEPPRFGHMPMILGSDQKKLSKRHAATAVGQYQGAGYLPETMFNFLTLLGWSSGDDRELFSREKLIQLFSAEGISKKSAVFDEKKLEWMNGQYLNSKSDADFSSIVIEQLVQANAITADFAKDNADYLAEMAAQIKPRVKLLAELPAMTAYFFSDPETYDQKAVKKHWKAPDQATRFAQISTKLKMLSDFSVEEIETVLRHYAEELAVGAGKIVQPLRIAVTGIAATPGMFEVMSLLGKETVVRRLEKAIQHIEKSAHEQVTE